MIPGRRAPTGELYVVAGTPAVGVPRSGGVALRNDGAVFYATTAPAVFANGLPLTNAGSLCMSVGAPIAKYAMGLPFAANGSLVASMRPAANAGDAWVGGVRVHPTLGIAITDAVPSDLGPFDAGFDGGYA